MSVRRLPWFVFAELAWLVVQRVREDLPERDRRRALELLRASKGDPRRMTPLERGELRRIVSQVDVRGIAGEAARRQMPFGRRGHGGGFFGRH